MSLEELDSILDLLVFLDSSSSGSKSLFEKSESSLIDLLNSHLEKLKNSLLEWRELSDSVHEFSNLSDSVAGSGLSIHRSFLGFEFGNNKSFMESEGVAEYAVSGRLRHRIYKFFSFYF